MITLKDKLTIIQMHLRGISNRKIAKTLGIDKKTVNKYVSEFEQAQIDLTGQGELDQEAVRAATQIVTAAPEYKKRKSPSRKWNAEMDEFLDRILAAEEEKRKRLRTGKQQLKKFQILQLMQDEGFDIGYTTVCRKVNQKRTKEKEAFIAQQYGFGQRFEFDFGEAHLYIAGKFTKAFIAVMSAPASGYRFARIYLNQKFEVFVDAQVRFFEHMGGCFEEGVYDNMRNVVKKFIGKNEKELNDGLVKLALYYGFRINVTNCFSGNEKGTVERSVEVVRNAAFSAKWEFNSLEDAQKHLDSALEKLNQHALLDEERAALTPYRPAYEVADIRAGCVVDKYSCVRYDKVSYSVPDCFVGKSMCVKAYPTQIVILHKGEEVARHARSYEPGGMVLEINHYLSTFRRKPGALANSRVLAAKADLKELFEREYADNPREFIAILSAHAEGCFDDALLALRTHRPIHCEQHVPASDHIALQTQKQIACIGAIGRRAA